AGRSDDRSRRPVPDHMTDVLIIGGGASGVLLAVHLLRDRPGGHRVTILECRPTLGAGIAYATNHPDHLLNVRASNMSAFPEEPGHFARWLHEQNTSGAAAPGYDLDSFAPRELYRDYLASLLKPLFATGRLRHAQVEAVAIRETPAGMEVESRDGLRHRG